MTLKSVFHQSVRVFNKNSHAHAKSVKLVCDSNSADAYILGVLVKPGGKQDQEQRIAW